MQSRLVRLGKDDLRNYFIEDALYKKIQSNKMQVLGMDKIPASYMRNQLLDIEISLRRCKRLGILR